VTQKIELPRPTNNNHTAWRNYWISIGHFWRGEPEIPLDRQQFLQGKLDAARDSRYRIYPFQGVPLNRADIEWLLAVHDNGKGPVHWDDASQQHRRGLDLRGADLRGADLSLLPLTRTRMGMTAAEWLAASPEQRQQATTHMEGANLFKAHLERVNGIEARLEGANLQLAHLEGAVLYSAHFEGKRLDASELETIRQVWPSCPETLQGANLKGSYMDETTDLEEALLGDRTTAACLADIRWGNVNLAVINWNGMIQTGDEILARQPQDSATGKRKAPKQRKAEFAAAVRSSRQLAAILRNQGLNEEADRFAFRAQNCHRQILRRDGRKSLGAYLGSLSLYLLAGYGYRPLRSFLAYVCVIIGFTLLYLINSQFAAPHLSWNEAIVLSMSSFHGRGFFNPNIALGDTYAQISVVEAFIGLIIEVSFIATFTQRFFGK
jgi:uncharacterized protein YjbI with pentapeptide repeats